MKETIFITGATGFLGSYLLRKLLHYKNHTIGNIIALSRGETQKETERRVRQSLWGQLPLRQKRGLISLLEVVRGDIAKENLGLSKAAYNRIIKKVTIIYHSAAICEFGVPLPVIRKTNVDGTRNVLELALACKKQGGFKRFHHISTVAVAGDRKGVFYENELDLGQKFNNTYEQSKFEAEKMGERYRDKGLPITTYRPSIIVGDSSTGYTNNFKMLYQPLHLFCMELYKEIPASGNTFFSFVPVDYTAEAIIRISLDNCAGNHSVYHITNPNETNFGYFLDMACKYFKFRKPVLTPGEKFSFEKYTPLQIELLKPFIPYFNYKVRFDASNAQKILKKTNFKWPKVNAQFLRRLFKFCVKSGFIRRKRK
ncbi:MAG: SDR family oxidoreductase [Candidatus Omnitrophica bacterium]|nr:SDR family oxidoreductase [Candidatus Omnitrophota bacterium]